MKPSKWSTRSGGMYSACTAKFNQDSESAPMQSINCVSIRLVDNIERITPTRHITFVGNCIFHSFLFRPTRKVHQTLHACKKNHIFIMQQFINPINKSSIPIKKSDQFVGRVHKFSVVRLSDTIVCVYNMLVLISFSMVVDQNDKLNSKMIAVLGPNKPFACHILIFPS